LPDKTIHALSDGAPIQASDTFYFVRSPFSAPNDYNIEWSELNAAVLTNPLSTFAAPTGYVSMNSQGLTGVAQVVGVGISTTASGVNLAGSTTLNVASTANFPASGTINVGGSSYTYSSKTSTSFALGSLLTFSTAGGEPVYLQMLQVGNQTSFQTAPGNAALASVRASGFTTDNSDYMTVIQMAVNYYTPSGSKIDEKAPLLVQVLNKVGQWDGSHGVQADAIHAQAYIDVSVQDGWAGGGTFEARHVQNTSIAVAHGTITTSGTGAANGDTVTIGSVTYTFVDSNHFTNAFNQVLCDGTIDHDLANLQAAINLGAGAGTLYGSPASTTVSGVNTAGSTILDVGSTTNFPNVGSFYLGGLTYTYSSKSGASFSGLSPALAFTTQGGETLLNINTDVTCSAVSSHAVTITTKKTGATLTFSKTGSGALTLSGSGNLVYDGSNSGTIYVLTTAGFPTPGVGDCANPAPAYLNGTLFTYTGISGNTLTGCSSHLAINSGDIVSCHSDGGLVGVEGSVIQYGAVVTSADDGAAKWNFIGGSRGTTQATGFTRMGNNANGWYYGHFMRYAQYFIHMEKPVSSGGVAIDMLSHTNWASTIITLPNRLSGNGGGGIGIRDSVGDVLNLANIDGNDNLIFGDSTTTMQFQGVVTGGVTIDNGTASPNTAIFGKWQGSSNKYQMLGINATNGIVFGDDSAAAAMHGTGFTVTCGMALSDGKNFSIGTILGTKFGASNSKMSWFGAAVRGQAAAITAPSGGSTVDTQARTAINSILALLSAGSGGFGFTA